MHNGHGKAPQSTSKLFDDILTRAEAEDARNNDRERLFKITTQLVKLNLGKSTSGSKEYFANIWNTFLSFLQRYPEYIVHRPSLAENGSNGIAESSTDAALHDSSEPMLVWLLPRVLSRLAAMTSFITEVDQEALRQKQALEQWLSSAIASLGAQLCNVRSNGVGLQREIVEELILLLHSEAIFGLHQSMCAENLILCSTTGAWAYTNGVAMPNYDVFPGKFVKTTVRGGRSLHCRCRP